MSKTEQPLDKAKNYLHNKGLLVPVICVIVGLLFGAIFGLALSNHDAPSKTVAAPAKTVAAAPVEVPTTPQECLDALDEADRGFNLASDTASEYQDAITAIEAGDIDGVTTATKHLKSINTSLNNLVPDYNSDKESCRSSAAQ